MMIFQSELLLTVSVLKLQQTIHIFNDSFEKLWQKLKNFVIIWKRKKMKETFSDRQTQQQKNNDHSTDSD